VTALLVARAQVIGEDPGLLTPLSGTATLVLSVAWLVAAVGWAARRAWSGLTTWRGSGVELGLLAVVAVQFLSAAGAAPYKHPAWLVAWEWGVLLVGFALVRQLAREEGDNRGLLAALLATAVSLSAYAVYQYTVELPQTRALLEPTDEDREEAGKELARLGVPTGADEAALETWAHKQRLRQRLAGQNLRLELDDPQLENWLRRAEMTNVYGTFTHPNSFAGYLALLLPALVGWSAAAPWRGPAAWRGGLTAACAVLLGVALWLTHSRGALLGTLVGLAMFGFALGRHLSARQRLTLAAAGALAVALLALALAVGGKVLGKEGRTVSYRLDYWTATWAMIRDHPGLGVGPGNFGREYPRYMVPTYYEKVQDPHNFALELWATSGLFGVVALLGALAALFWHTRAAWGTARPVAAVPQPPYDPARRWTFYLGGAAGLLVGFLLRAGGLSGDDILVEGFVSGARSVLWFAVFALLDGIPWSGPTRLVALLAGVVALLINLTVSGGIGLPSVALPLWVVAALALNTLEHSPREWSAASWVGRYLPLPLTAGLVLAYIAFIFQPITEAAAQLQKARERYGAYEQGLQQLLQGLDKETKPEVRWRALAGAVSRLSTDILDPLLRANRADPGDVLPLAELAHWYGQMAKLDPGNRDLARKAVDFAEKAQKLDPDGNEGFLAESRVRVQFAEQDKAHAVEEYGYVARALRAAVRNDPTEARLRYEFAEALFKAHNAVEGRREAEEALRLDELAPQPSRKLKSRQREQVLRWLERPPPG
jgi:O-antigen ligase